VFITSGRKCQREPRIQESPVHLEGTGFIKVSPVHLEGTNQFNVGKASAVIVCISDQAECTRAVIALRRWYPDLKIFARARNKDHAYRLQSTLDVAAMVPILPEDNVLLAIPFGGAVLKALGGSPEEVNAILETKRKEVMGGKMTEDDMTLVQLGIEPTEKKQSEVDATEVASEDADYETYIQDAVVERLEEVQETSPFVAQIIGQSSTSEAEVEVEEEAAAVATADAPALEVVETETAEDTANGELSVEANGDSKGEDDA